MWAMRVGGHGGGGTGSDAQRGCPGVQRVGGWPLSGLARLDVRDREVDSSQAASWRVSLYAIRARGTVIAQGRVITASYSARG